MRFIADGKPQQVQKDPNEIIVAYYDWVNSGDLNTDGTVSSLSSASMVVTDPDGADVTSTLLASSTAVITGVKTFFTMAAAGTTALDYKMILTAIFANTSVRKQVLTIMVRAL